MAESTQTVAQLLQEVEELGREVARLRVAEQERLRVESELRRTTSELEVVFRALPDLKFRLDADGTILDFLAGRVTDLYLPPEQFLGKRMQDVLPPEAGGLFDTGIRQVRAGEPQVSIEYQLEIGGGTRYFEARLLPLLEGQVLVIVRDIGPRRRREAMRTARQRVREAVLRMQGSEDLEEVLVAIRDSIEALAIPFNDCGINVVEATGQGLVCRSYNLVKNSGWQVSAEAPGVKIVDRIWRAGQVAYRRDLAAQDAHQESAHLATTFGHPVRAVLDVPFSHGTLALNSTVPSAFSDQDVALVHEMAGMLSEGFQRMEDLQRLAAERERLAVTLRSIGDGVITTDAEGRVLLVNAVAEQLTGWRQEEAAGRSLAEVFRIVDERTRRPVPDPVARVLESGQVVGLANSTVLIARDGTERCIADSGAPIRTPQSQILGVVLVFRDVTMARRLQTELARREKLESVGVLAGGLAHDFNNLLVGILGNVSLARMELGPDTGASGFLADAEKAALRARSLTQQLLTFAQGGAPVRETASLKELVRESADFVLHGSTVQAEYALAENLWAAEVDRGQISQVIQNLVLNAAQAMPQGGVVRLSAANAILEEGPLPLPAGRYVRIEVSDLGVGIAAEHLGRIFDPYFTTKQRGSGLGLTTAYAIVESHGGHLAATSQLGEGSTFGVYLPAVGASPDARQEKPTGLVRGQGRVLVMDDEEMVRRLAGLMLARLGYEAELAGDGVEALECYRRAQAEGRGFAAVIMDLTVPGGMGGRETIARLLELDPNARAIVSSGYSNDPIMAQYRSHGFRAVIAKPYTLQGFSQVLQRVVAGQEG